MQLGAGLAGLAGLAMRGSPKGERDTLHDTIFASSRMDLNHDQPMTQW